VHFYFHEIRGSKFFLHPQRSSGEIIFKRDGYLLKEVTIPAKIKFVIKNNNLQLYSNLKGGTEKAGPLIPLNNYPQIAQFYNLTTNLLKGNAEFIEQYYDYTIQFQAPYWLLKLRPKMANRFIDEQQAVKDITIKGHLSLAYNNEIISIETSGFGTEYSNLYVDQIIDKTIYTKTFQTKTFNSKAINSKAITSETITSKTSTSETVTSKTSSYKTRTYITRTYITRDNK
jgi:hypothetical protein